MSLLIHPQKPLILFKYEITDGLAIENARSIIFTLEDAISVLMTLTTFKENHGVWVECASIEKYYPTKKIRGREFGNIYVPKEYVPPFIDHLQKLINSGKLKKTETQK